ncbi:MAG: TolC family protein [Burkholderiaceae bacterium]|nr:TolC family protein [Burkholderiaceae bacterium]
MVRSPQGRVRAAWSWGGLAAVVVLAGCAVTPQPLTVDEIAQRATEDRARMGENQEPVSAPLSFADVAARVLKYNLDFRQRMMEGALADRQLAVGQWDMFPALLANAGYVTRSNEAAYINDAGVVSAATSERTRRLAGLEFSWNLLDFGVSYYRARILADQVLIAEERKRKAIQTLMQETRHTYWRALGAQRLGDRLQELMKRSNVALAQARVIEQQGLLPQAQALAYQRALLDATTLLQLRRQDLEFAKIELASLMNLPHHVDFTLADEPEPDLPPVPAEIEKLEDLALVQRPELREEDYRRRITVNDTRRALTQTLPGISFSTGWQYDSNRYLLNNSWVETGLRVSANLFRLASIPSIRRAGEAQEQLDDTRRLAQAMAVATQVRLAALRYRIARDGLDQAAESARVDFRLAEYTRAAASSRVDSELELLRTEARSLLSEYERHIAFADVQAAWGRLYNSVGYDLVPAEADASLAMLSRSIRDSLNEWHRATFERPPADKSSLAPLRLRVAGLDADAGEAVRAAVGAGLTRAGLRLAADERASAWTLELVPESDIVPGEGAMSRWTLRLLDANGRLALRASHAIALAGDRSAEALAASARAAIEAAMVAMTDELRSAGRTEVASR